HYITITVALIGWAVTAYRAFQAGTPIPLPPVVDIAEAPAPGGDSPRPMGWVDDQTAVQQVVAQLQIKVFRDTPAFEAMGDEPEHAYLWDYAKAARGGQHIPARDQGQVGSCVSFGSACADE